jgi:hypothetical protein
MTFEKQSETRNTGNSPIINRDTSKNLCHVKHHNVNYFFLSEGKSEQIKATNWL